MAITQEKNNFSKNESLGYQATAILILNKWLSRLCDQNCGVQCLNRQTDGRTDRKVKTEGPKIIFIESRLRLTLIIGGPTTPKKGDHVIVCGQVG